MRKKKIRKEGGVMVVDIPEVYSIMLIIPVLEDCG